MTKTFYNNVRAGEAVELSEAAIRSYAKKYGVPSFKNSLGHTQYPESMLDVFRQIRGLKALEKDDATIRATIAPALEAGWQELQEAPEAQGVDIEKAKAEILNQARADLAQGQETVISHFMATLRQDLEQTHQLVGELRAQRDLALEQLQAAQQQTRLLPEHAESLQAAREKALLSESERNQALEKVDLAHGELAQMRQQLAAAEARSLQLERENAELKGQVEFYRLQAADAQAQAAEAREKLVAQSGQLGECAARRELLEQDLAAAEQALEAERKKGFFQKLIK